MVVEESALREKARECIASGALPQHAPHGTWGGAGSGAKCALCAIEISMRDLEMEVEFSPQPTSSYHFHGRCFAAWESERYVLDGSRSEKANRMRNDSALMETARPTTNQAGEPA
jgi:hypothetical protein